MGWRPSKAYVIIFCLGVLYLLKKDLFFRISVGSAGDEKSKLKRSKTLAQRALKRI
jgi:hypothetical protein